MEKIIQKEELKWACNKYYSTTYNEEELSFFNDEEIQKVHQFQKSHPSFTETPLIQLTNLSNHLNLADIRVKDESFRFGLNAFKVLGGIYAIAKYLADRLGRSIEDLSFEELRSKHVKEVLGNLTFISATDGNHGRGVAWAARELGHQSVIYMPKGSSTQRLTAIRNEGAKSDITDFNYDDTVRMCAELARKNGWIMVQDTAWEGYDEIPLWIMQGYASLAKEVVEQLEDENGEPPTHIFLQAGVGSFAAGITGYMVQHFRENPPIIVIVEPDKADCFYRSFATKDGTREIVSGEMNTIMAGLACGEPNTRAFRILRQYGKLAFSCADSVSALGMRVLGNPMQDDLRVISGESGAVPLGLLYLLRKDTSYQEACNLLSLNNTSRVLVISTEGDTDPEHYQEVVWKGHYSNY